MIRRTSGGLVLTAALGVLAFGSAPALAMSCDDIVNMVTLGIPNAIVIETMKSSGHQFTAEDIQCLKTKKAPADVIATAQSMSGGSTPAPAPTAPNPVPAPAPVSGFESDDTLGGPDVQQGAGPVSGDEQNVDDQEPTGGGPPELESAIEAYRAKKYLTSSNALYEMLRDGRYPDQETKIQYYLAKSLYDLQLYHSAQHYFMEVVRKGPSNPYFKYALPRMVAISDHTGNDYELLRIVTKIPPEAFPRQAKSHLYYLLGRKAFEKEDLTDAAEYFAQVSSKDPTYMRAKYYEGIIDQQRGKLKSSVMAFREVMDAQPPIVADARSAKEVEDMKDLALMNIARIYYGLERYDNADKYYGLVSRDSSYWAESLFERAWTNFLTKDLNLTLGLLLTVDSPYFHDSDFIPEVTYLRALTFFNLCEYNEVERILTGFDAKYKPMQAEVEGFLNQYKDQKDIWDQAYDQYFSNPNESSALPPAAFARILRNRDLGAMVRTLDAMDQEEAMINAQKAQWKDTVGDELLKVIEADRVLYKKKAGNELLKEMLKLNDMLKDLLVRSEIVRFEVVDAQRADYEFKSQGNVVDAGDKERIDYAKTPDIIYWPFNGEFWRDELGYYRYTEHGECQ
jgi:TolA-binding protein